MYNFYIDTLNNQNHIAVMDDKTHIMEDIFLDYPKGYATHNPRWAAIYYARVDKIDKKLNCAFVDLGNDMKALLQAKHIHISGEVRKKLPSHNKTPIISDLVQSGDWIFVQIKSETEDCADANKHSSDLQKLPRVTNKIIIAGRTLLYSPNVLGVRSTHWVNKDDEERTGYKLTNEHDKGGWVIRQMAPDLPNDILHLEAESLIGMWKRAKHRARDARENQTPKCVMTAPNAIERSLIDYARRGISHFECMDSEQATIAKTWAERFAPDLIPQIRIAQFSPQDRVKSLFEAHDINYMIDALSEELVPLPSGGNIIIETTHACTVIDVNSASASTFDTNIEAASEIMRQIRLRNIGGMIICDVINEHARTKRRQILSTFENSCTHDPADPQIHGFTKLMMCEITRRRRTAAICNKSKLAIKSNFTEVI